MGYDDIGTDGETTQRFKYAAVAPEDFGLTTAEILLADDKVA